MKTSDLELLLDSNIYDEVIFKTTEYTLQYLSSISLLEGGNSLHPDNIHNYSLQESFPREIIDSINRITSKWGIDYAFLCYDSSKKSVEIF